MFLLFRGMSNFFYLTSTSYYRENHTRISPVTVTLKNYVKLSIFYRKSFILSRAAFISALEYMWATELTALV